MPEKQTDKFEPTPKELENPATSALLRVAAMQSEQVRQGERLSGVCRALYGDREGTGAGLIEQVRSHDRWIKKRDKIEGAVITFVVLAIIGALIATPQLFMGDEAKGGAPKSVTQQGTKHGG